MPNEILNIQHTITQLQNVEKVQAVGQQREQYQQKQEAVHLQEKKVLEQTIVQISEEAENIFFKEEGGKDKGKHGNGKREKRGEDVEMQHEGDEGNFLEEGNEHQEGIDIVV